MIVKEIIQEIYDVYTGIEHSVATIDINKKT